MARLGHTRKNRAGGRSGGRSIGLRVSMQTRGLNALERKIQRLSDVGDWDAGLGTTATSGAFTGKNVNRTDTSKERIGKLVGGLLSRSAFDNARLWRAHRNSGRNPFVYDNGKGVALWKAGADREIAGTGSMKDAALSVARYMKDAVEARVASGSGIRPLSEKYGKWKRKYFGDKPVLMLTGQLVKSLRLVAMEMR